MKENIAKLKKDIEVNLKGHDPSEWALFGIGVVVSLMIAGAIVALIMLRG